MVNETKKQLLSIMKHFRISGTPDGVNEITSGHINGTFVIFCSDSDVKYILQRVNTDIFKNYVGLMNNIEQITSFLRDKYARMGYADSDRRTLHIVRTVDDTLYHIDENGSVWRVYDFVRDATCYQTVESEEMFRKVGVAFGRFQRDLADFDASMLVETIPNFHNTVNRFENLMASVKADKAGRLSEVKAELDFVLARRSLCEYIVEKLSDGRLPLRVTHNDTKLNNIMIDDATGEGICVIDLDTVMPGSVLYDFGDSIRFGASSAAEDETDLSKVYMRDEMFSAFASGFVSALDGALSREEILDLPMGAIIITLEVGIRFLTDYLDGDTYFRTEYPGHNLDRARNQFKLVVDMESKLDGMIATVKQFI